jgi:aminopeptidase N
VVAASSQPTVAGEWLHYEYLSARNFAWSVSHLYKVATRQVGTVTVKAYTFPVHAGAGEAALQTTVEALTLYSRLLGDYPRESLSVIEADFLDGMEYDGLYFLSKGFYNLYSGTPGEYLIAIAAHETAHQWWYARVGNDQAIEPWLDEALCTFSERLYYENVHPEAMEWWQQYRVNYWEPKGWVDGTIYNPEGYRAYRDAVYLNGAVFLGELRGEIGEQAFMDFLKAYIQENDGQIATADDFFAILEGYSRSDLTPLIEQYFSKR